MDNTKIATPVPPTWKELLKIEKQLEMLEKEKHCKL
jgi:hypothetical protein